MAEVGLVAHEHRDLAPALVAEAAEWLEARGHDVRILADAARRCGRTDLAWDAHDLPVGLDLLVGIGGDGTILRTVDLAGDEGVPVLGVNVGRLGYLTVVEPDELRMALKRFLAGAYRVEDRMRLASQIRRADGSTEPLPTALNEVVVERAAPGHTVRLGVDVDDEPFTPYVADGLIVATPTGSTAYAFSVRGPILAPTLRALLIAPVSPHMLFDRCLVLGPDSGVNLTVTDHRPAVVSVDGRQVATVADGEQVRCIAADRPARLVTFGRRDFHRVLRAKFGLPDR